MKISFAATEKGMKEMNCYDCIHNGVCYLQEVTNDIEEQLREFGCENYKCKEDFAEIVYCKDCEHRGTLKCPMFDYEYREWSEDYEEIDSTEDIGFCHCGERE